MPNNQRISTFLNSDKGKSQLKKAIRKAMVPGSDGAVTRDSLSRVFNDIPVDDGYTLDIAKEFDLYMEHNNIEAWFLLAIHKATKDLFQESGDWHGYLQTIFDEVFSHSEELSGINQADFLIEPKHKRNFIRAYVTSLITSPLAASEKGPILAAPYGSDEEPVIISSWITRQLQSLQFDSLTEASKTLVRLEGTTSSYLENSGNDAEQAVCLFSINKQVAMEREDAFYNLISARSFHTQLESNLGTYDEFLTFCDSINDSNLKALKSFDVQARFSSAGNLMILSLLEQAYIKVKDSFSESVELPKIARKFVGVLQNHYLKVVENMVNQYRCNSERPVSKGDLEAIKFLQNSEGLLDQQTNSWQQHVVKRTHVRGEVTKALMPIQDRVTEVVEIGDYKKFCRIA